MQVPTILVCVRATCGWFCVGAFLLLLVNPLAWASCDLSSRQLEENAIVASVAKVIDGDTIRLTDQRLVRLIGVNTPEIDYENGYSQPLAEKAKAVLVETLLTTGNKIVLQFDQQQRDRHDRWLAHVYASNGANIQSLLLRNGLAYWVVISPNLKNRRCYQTQEQTARKAGAGIWGLHLYQAIPVEALTQQHTGFQLLKGRISRIEQGRSALWLNFATPKSGPSVALRISSTELHYFDQYDLNLLENKVVTVRGWLHLYNTGLVMRVTHPAVLQSPGW